MARGGGTDGEGVKGKKKKSNAMSHSALAAGEGDQGEVGVDERRRR